MDSTRMERFKRMKKRLLEVFELLSLSIPQVSKKSGVKGNTLNQMKLDRTESMNCHTLADIIRAYPQINANYILTGTGEPILNDKVDAESTLLLEELTDLVKRHTKQ